MDTHPRESLQDRTKTKTHTEKSLLIDEKKYGKVNTPQEKSIFDLFQNKMYLNIIANGFLILAVILYILTLVGCDEIQAECLKKFDQKLIKYFVWALSSCAILFSLIFNLAIYKKIHYAIPIYTAIIIAFLCFVYDTGTDLKSHGSYNRNFLFILMLTFFLIQNLIFYTFKVMRQVGVIKSSLGLILLILLSAGTLHYKLGQNCQNWNKGLKETELDNTVPGCRVRQPYYCWMNLMDNVFDISGWMGENCEQIRMDSREQLVRWTRTPNAKVIGLPRVTNWKFFPDSTLNEFQFRVLSKTIDMEDPRVDQKLKDSTEIIIDFKKEHPEMSLRVVRDENLIKSRINKRSAYKNTNFITKNVIHLFIDSLSRDNFRRKLPKSKIWLEKYFDNQKSDARVYQFFKYHALAAYTFINMIPTTFGVDGSYKGRAVHSNKFYKDKGFITGQAHNYCGREFYDLEPGNVEEFQFENFDHEANLLGCDPNYSVPGHPFAMLNGPYGMKRRCLYGKDTSHYVFEYGKKYWKAYEDQPKYLRLAFLDAHEGTGEVVKYMDDKLVDFFEFLEKENSLKDTVILFQSDHGVNMPGFYTFVDAQDFWIEKTLPTLFLIVPQDVAKEYDTILKEKENLLLSPYDLHNTFLHLAASPKTYYNEIGKSLFLKTDDLERRNCNWFRVQDPYCQCIGEREN